MSSSTWNWPEKESQLEELQEEFIQAVHKYIFKADSYALGWLEEDGAGELVGGRSEKVKNNILALFLPLVPQPRRITVPIQPPLLLPRAPYASNWEGLVSRSSYHNRLSLW